MLHFILSPAKKLAALSDCPQIALANPALIMQAEILVKKMRTFAPHDLAQLMGISDKLSLLNVQRFAEWSNDLQHAAAAVYLFNGDAYNGL
ncbi:MAG: peroxide stress protein YaaA, partial [Neisseriaceae bacterium]|nr:peroxide stress protein YaaA [Neisseriaceae bacterium]